MVANLSDAEEIVRRGQEIYDAHLRKTVEPGNIGRFVVIDVDTGDYVLGDDMVELADRLHARRPGAPLYTARVGFPYTDRLGRRIRVKAQ